MGGICCKEAEPELNPDGSVKELPPLEQQLRDPEELRKAARSEDAAQLEVLMRRMPRAAINSGTTKEESTPDQQGNTALHIAAAANWLTGCRMLVLYGASQRTRNASGKTPLHMAVEAGKRKVTAYLLELQELPQVVTSPNKPPPPVKPWRGGDVNAKDGAGRSVLLTAFLTGRQQFTTWFIAACNAYDRVLDFDITNTEGEGVALCCARFSWWDLLKDKVLPALHNVSKVVNTANKDNETVLGWLLKYLVAGEMTAEDVVAWIDLFPGLDVTVSTFKERIPPLSMAAAAGAQGLVDKMIGMGLPTMVSAKDAMGRSALHYAAAHGQKEMALYLASLGVKVTEADKTKATPYHLAATRGHGDLARELLRTLPDLEKAAALKAVNNHGYNMAHLCLLSRKCDDASQEAILNLLALMDDAVLTLPVQDKKKDPPLMLAIGSHLDLVVKHMLDQGISCNVPNMLQEYPLARNLQSVTKDTAARDSHIFDMLIKAGAVVDTPNPATHPLMAVCRNDVSEFSALAIKTLDDLSTGKLLVPPPPPPPPSKDGKTPPPPPEPKPPGPLDWEKEDEEGRGPLMLAAAHNNTYIIKYLVHLSPDLINKQAEGNGMSPLMWAASHASRDALRVLLDLGADVLMTDKSGHDAMWHALRLDKPETLDCAAMLLLKGAKARVTKSDAQKALEYLDITGEGWLHRAVRYGAVEFIRLWGRMGGSLGIQCSTPETADDMPGANAVSTAQVDFLEAPLEEQEEEAWEVEEVEPDASGEGLQVDVNHKLAAPATNPKAAGPVAESALMGCDNLGYMAASFVTALRREDLMAWRKLGHKWFDVYCDDARVMRDQDDPVCEEQHELIEKLAAQQTGQGCDKAHMEHVSYMDPYAVEYHVYEQLNRQQHMQAQAVAEGAQVDRATLAASVGSWLSRTHSDGEQQVLGSPRGGGGGRGRLAAHQRALCEAVVMEKEDMEAEVLQQIELDMGFDELLLSGQDPLHPDLLAARRPGSAARTAVTSGGPGPIAEAKVHPEPLEPAISAASVAQSASKSFNKSMTNAGKSMMRVLEKHVVNNDPYYAQTAPDVEMLYATRKYEGEPAYIVSARDRSKRYTAQELDAKANELNARMSGYSEKDKKADGGVMLIGASLRARNITWWNRTLCPEEYPIKLGVWRRLDKKKEQAIASARARAPAAPGATIKPRKKTAIFGLPDMPSRPELLQTGAVTYAVRLNRPDCVSALLNLSAGTVNQMDGYGYPPLSYALLMLSREPANKTLAFTVDTLLSALPDGNLITRFRPVLDPRKRKDLIKFVKKNMDRFGDCWVRSNVVDDSCCSGGKMLPDEDATIAKLYAKVLSPGQGAMEAVSEVHRSARSMLGLCRADPLEPLVALVAMGDVARLAWLVRKCGASLEAAWVHLPDIPTYYQGLLEKDVATCLSVCSPLHIAVAMRKFELVRAVLDLGSDPNACGTPRQEEVHNPWAYSASLDKVRDRMKKDWAEDLKDRSQSGERRKAVDEQVLFPADKAKSNFKQGSDPVSAIMDGTDTKPGSEQPMTEEERKAFEEESNKVKDNIAGGFLAKLSRMKKLFLSIEIPGFTRPHPWVTPLHLAARGGQADIAFILINRGSLPDGGVSRLFAKRNPLQEAMMYARANYVEANTQAQRVHHNEMERCIDASVAPMNDVLVGKVAMEAVNLVMSGKFMDPTTMSLKAFALTVKIVIKVVMAMRSRPVAHWDPALATAHVLMLERAPVDAADTQTSIVVRDLMDNSSWMWLGAGIKDGIDDQKWLYEAQLYVYRVKNSDNVGWQKMTLTTDIKWYRWAKTFLTNRCDTAYFGAGARALTSVYNTMSEVALKKITKVASDRATDLKIERTAILTAATQARQQLLKTQGALMGDSMQAAAEELGSPCVFDNESFLLLMNETSALTQATLTEAAQTAAAETQVRSQTQGAPNPDGGWTELTDMMTPEGDESVMETLDGAMDSVTQGVMETADEVAGSIAQASDVLKTAKGMVTSAEDVAKSVESLIHGGTAAASLIKSVEDKLKGGPVSDGLAKADSLIKTAEDVLGGSGMLKSAEGLLDGARTAVIDAVKGTPLATGSLAKADSLIRAAEELLNGTPGALAVKGGPGPVAESVGEDALNGGQMAAIAKAAEVAIAGGGVALDKAESALKLAEGVVNGGALSKAVTSVRIAEEAMGGALNKAEGFAKAVEWPTLGGEDGIGAADQMIKVGSQVGNLLCEELATKSMGAGLDLAADMVERTKSGMMQRVKSMGAGVQWCTPFSMPENQPLKADAGLLAEVGQATAAKAASSMKAQLKDMAQNAAKDIETTAAECCQDTVLAFREMALGNMEGAEALVTDAAQSMADRLEAIGEMAGGWDPSADMGDVSVETPDIEGAIASVGELLDGIMELLELAL